MKLKTLYGIVVTLILMIALVNVNNVFAGGTEKRILWKYHDRTIEDVNKVHQSESQLCALAVFANMTGFANPNFTAQETWTIIKSELPNSNTNIWLLLDMVCEDSDKKCEVCPLRQAFSYTQKNILDFVVGSLIRGEVVGLTYEYKNSKDKIAYHIITVYGFYYNKDDVLILYTVDSDDKDIKIYQNTTYPRDGDDYMFTYDISVKLVEAYSLPIVK